MDRRPAANAIAALLVAATFATVAPAAASPVVLTGPTGTKYEAVVTETVLQKKTATTPTILQPALSMYEIGPQGRRKVWTAPSAVVPRLERVSKYPMGWLPLVETVSSLTAVSLVPSDGQQLAFTLHQSAADCGSSSVHVIGLAKGSWRELINVQNPCALTFTASGASLALAGPGYKPSDPLCCPSTPKATAKLSYQNGAWKLTPHVFRLTVPAKG